MIEQLTRRLFFYNLVKFNALLECIMIAGNVDAMNCTRKKHNCNEGKKHMTWHQNNVINGPQPDAVKHANATRLTIQKNRVET